MKIYTPKPYLYGNVARLSWIALVICVAYELVDLLFDKMSLSGKLKVYPAFVCEGDDDMQKPMRDGFVKGEKRFARYVYDKFSEKSYYNKLSFARGVACRLSCLNNFCIGPDGELYKCEHHFGRKGYIVGNVFSGERWRFLQEFDSAIHARNGDCKSYIEHLTECQARRVVQQ